MASGRAERGQATMLLVSTLSCVMPNPSPLPQPQPAGLELAAPDGVALLAREDQARRLGSGLSAERICGHWCLERVWSKGASEPSAVSGALLRGLGARLEIAVAPAGSDAPLQLCNAVRLGALELRFHGSAWLQGRRPLLLFGFERLELRWGRWVVVTRTLPPPPPRRQPFFALIGRGDDWLAARGRGGGLALWRPWVCERPLASPAWEPSRGDR